MKGAQSESTVRVWARVSVPAAVLGLVLVAATSGTGRPAALTDAAPEVTWSDDVAPIIAENCLGCHGLDGSAPFELATYGGAARRADRIALETAARRMPPWLPRSEPGVFAGQRGLTEDEIEILGAWAEGGALRGSAPSDTLWLPDNARGWDPGPPDLVVPLPTYRLPADGHDVYRNLVVAIPVEETRWVEYVELKPGGRSVVHHARMMIDRTASSRAMDRADAEPGFDGMELVSDARDPDGHFIGWTPGKTRLPPIEGMAWRLDPGTDLVVQLHLRTSGRPETVEAAVEFHFADEPARLDPVVLVVSSLQIDIPPGATDYTVANSFTLPVDVDVLSVYPHAHYLGKDLRARAVLPGDREVELVHIPDWDFDWQDEYRFAQPLSLPAGTRIVKEFTFDNSASNPHNPADPPVRVVYGSNSDDEMADLILQVLPGSRRDRDELVQAQAWQHQAEDMAYMAEFEFDLGTQALRTGDLDRAVAHFQETLQYRADHVGALVGLADIFVERADAQSAMIIARQAVLMSREGDATAFAALARAQALAGDLAAARATARRALALAASAGDSSVVASVRERLAGLIG